MSFSQQIRHDKSFHLAPKSKNCQFATFQCYAERSRYTRGIQKVHFSPTRWQLFCNKKGWGIDPRDPRQKIKTCRPRYFPWANSSKNAHMSVFAFHRCRFIYFFLKIKGVFSYSDMYLYSFLPKNTSVQFFRYVRLILFFCRKYRWMIWV